MHVLVVMRDDRDQVFGGDTVMVRKIEKYLRPYGVHFEYSTAWQLKEEFKADIVHITFLHLVESVQHTVQWAQIHRIPVVISPLFEIPLVMWFQRAITWSRKWRLLSKIFGRRFTQRLYVAWRTERIKRSSQWQMQRDLLQSIKIVTNSYYERDRLARWFDLSCLDATVVPLGIDPEVFNRECVGHPPAALNGLTGYVLEVGRIEGRKNQLGLLKALYDLPVPIVFLGQANQSSYEAAYVEECRQLAMDRGEVYFLEHVPEADLPSLYSMAAVHVLPSWFEFPGLVTLEAAACGCKVVSTSFSPIYEYLGEDAWYCRPDSIRSIRVATQQALSSPISKDLQARVLNNFTWEKTARKMFDVYQQLLS